MILIRNEKVAYLPFKLTNPSWFVKWIQSLLKCFGLFVVSYVFVINIYNAIHPLTISLILAKSFSFCFFYICDKFYLQFCTVLTWTTYLCIYINMYIDIYSLVLIRFPYQVRFSRSLFVVPSIPHFILSWFSTRYLSSLWAIYPGSVTVLYLLLYIRFAVSRFDGGPVSEISTDCQSPARWPICSGRSISFPQKNKCCVLASCVFGPKF